MLGRSSVGLQNLSILWYSAWAIKCWQITDDAKFYCTTQLAWYHKRETVGSWPIALINNHEDQHCALKIFLNGIDWSKHKGAMSVPILVDIALLWFDESKCKKSFQVLPAIITSHIKRTDPSPPSTLSLYSVKNVIGDTKSDLDVKLPTLPSGLKYWTSKLIVVWKKVSTRSCY